MDHRKDNLYLTPLIKQVETELKEKHDLDLMIPNKKHKTNGA